VFSNWKTRPCLSNEGMAFEMSRTASNAEHRQDSSTGCLRTDHTPIYLFIHSLIHCIMSAFDESAWLQGTWQTRVAVEGRLVASVWVQTEHRSNDSSRDDAGWAEVLESLSKQSKWLWVYCTGQWTSRGAATVVVSTWPHLVTAKARWHCGIVTPTLNDDLPLPMPSRR
jgi:hypothetical protein